MIWAESTIELLARLQGLEIECARAVLHMRRVAAGSFFVPTAGGCLPQPAQRRVPITWLQPAGDLFDLTAPAGGAGNAASPADPGTSGLAPSRLLNPNAHVTQPYPKGRWTT